MITVGMATVPANSTVAVFMIPPGTVNTVIYQPSIAATAQSVYIGSSGKVSSTNGMLVPVTPLSTDSYVSASGMTVFATTGNATASSFQYIISTGQ